MALPKPETGLVIHYSYLWNDQHLEGQEEGTKNRPCVIAAIAQGDGGETIAYALPVTHRAPAKGTPAVEIPQAVKRSLGMDSERSWVICSEVNEFKWPGCDYCRTPDKRGSYGILPSGLFGAIKRNYGAALDGNGLKVVNRDGGFPRLEQ